MAVNKDMRGFFQFLLLLFAIVQLVHAEPTPRVDLPASDTLEILNPKVILERVRSGHFRQRTTLDSVG